MLGIIGAMQQEVAQLKEMMSEVTITQVAGMEFYQGILKEKSIVVVQSGIGKVNAAICVQILVDKFAVTGIINTGIAGSLNANIDIGDIVLSTDAVEHDMDTTIFGYEYGRTPGMDVTAYPADITLLETAKACCHVLGDEIGVHVGRVATGDQFISDKAKKEWIIEHVGGYCAEMEGAAIAHAAYLNKTPYLVVRAISDKADDSAEMDYPTFEKMAIANSIKLMLSMVEAL